MLRTLKDKEFTTLKIISKNVKNLTSYILNACINRKSFKNRTYFKLYFYTKYLFSCETCIIFCNNYRIIIQFFNFLENLKVMKKNPYG